MKFLKTALATTALAIGVSAGSASADEIEVKFGHVGGPGSLFEITANRFAELANERLEGVAEVNVYGSSQLGGDSSMLRRLRLGTLDLSLPSTIMSSEDDRFALFEMPYLIADREHMKKVREEVVKTDLYDAAEERGFKIIGVWENGTRHITNNERPINTPDDLDGIKLRTPSGVWRVEMFNSYGASPSPMSLSEVFVALQTGAMDGQENPLIQTYSSRFHEVQDYLSISGHVYTPAYVTAGASWNRLPEEVRDVLQDVATELEDFALEEGARLDEETLEKMKAEGMQVNEVDTQAFIDASQGIYDQFGSEVDGGQEMIETVSSLRE
ncbi:TRAP transporter substrate-binding protein [Halomonas urumqiensis]|uniref:C4-dicarboxylate ABC transporter n=1 Tax=Halomonas urumqiensis TaxID=1684789 RepID=A0A2N7UME6_9GAMM|nr:TRAP transporter substrate-binding protein [Halomonas urumqiensis]PMR81579.1 C4-dicarboxylate ABC transporter [Halomonas urumqiensis]PTB02216.1 C4-dicarboxylate ABC transporter [Halomonas urumqiensis]GHE21678.1 C4-dicarboxylate ABC transporter [Halomonas urumqiensis]